MDERTPQTNDFLEKKTQYIKWGSWETHSHTRGCFKAGSILTVARLNAEHQKSKECFSTDFYEGNSPRRIHFSGKLTSGLPHKHFRQVTMFSNVGMGYQHIALEMPVFSLTCEYQATFIFRCLTSGRKAWNSHLPLLVFFLQAKRKNIAI